MIDVYNLNHAVIVVCHFHFGFVYFSFFFTDFDATPSFSNDKFVCVRNESVCLCNDGLSIGK